MIEGQLSLEDFTRPTGKMVATIERCQSKPFIESIHYSRKYPSNIVYAFGLWEDGELIGVCTYGIPASHPLTIGLAGKENKDKVLELNRLAIKPGHGGVSMQVIL